jgi:adenylate kinase family enzyme
MTDESSSAAPLPADLPIAADSAMRRVLVIGAGGSGKSTLAARLSDHLGLPLIGLDVLYWKPGWVATPADEWSDRVRAMVAQEAWVMDGNYGATLDTRLARCDSVVFLDLPRFLCLWRIAWRAVRCVGRTRPDMPHGCPERLSWEFVVWVWTYPKRRRPEILRKIAALRGEKRVIILKSRRAISTFLSAL